MRQCDSGPHVCWSVGCLLPLLLCLSTYQVPGSLGFLHPIIHLGFGIEFNQPAIIAEALAQYVITTCTDVRIGVRRTQN